MPKLHLVGITPDHRGLVLSEHARAKRGDMVLEIDDRLAEAIAKAQRLRTRDEGHRLESAALPSRRTDGDSPASGRLSPREIQQRLRAGETIAALARASGTDQAWIQRFAAPVLAEQAEIIERARSLRVTKRGAGPSAATLGPAVAANVIDRGVPLTLPELEAGWGAYQRPEGGWHVTFTLPLRGRRQTAEWELDPATAELTPRNKLAGELGWREPGRKPAQPAPAKPAKATRRASSATTGRARPTPAKPDPATATDTGGPATPDPGSGDVVQSLPLTEEGPPEPAPGRTSVKPGRTSVKKGSSPAKRAAAASESGAAATVLPVPDTTVPDTTVPDTAAPAGSMPPTDLDVVDVAWFDPAAFDTGAFDTGAFDAGGFDELGDDVDDDLDEIELVVSVEAVPPPGAESESLPASAGGPPAL